MRGFMRLYADFVNFRVFFVFCGVSRSLVSSCGIFMELYGEFRNILNGYNMQSLLEFNEVL